MSAIFISHSSRDNEFCKGLYAWLDAQGHRSVFLDFDVSAGIEAGRSWEQKLYQELRACRAVIVVCSEHLMKSKWCFAEITHARSLGKHIFPIKIAPCDVEDSILADAQIVDFTALGEHEAYARLAHGMARAGIDAEDPFDWDGRRPPYPGLLAFQEEDAAIFFGREAEIGAGLDVLNRSLRFGRPGLVMTLGTSGSGKSSLVRAGMLPRLRRDPGRWLVVDPFRPGEDPFGALAQALAGAYLRDGRERKDAVEIRRALLDMADAEAPDAGRRATGSGAAEPAAERANPGDVRNAIAVLEALGAPGGRASSLLRSSLRDLRALQTELERPDSVRAPAGGGASFARLAGDLRATCGREDAGVLLVVDQFEELLGRPPHHAAHRFLSLLRAIVDTDDDGIVVLGTMRSDFLGVFQQDLALLGVDFGEIRLGPLDGSVLPDVIEKPARLAGVRVERTLVQALVDDTETDDALPLLAFTLRELYDKFGGDGVLELREYRDLLGGLQGAVAKAADGILEHPPLSDRDTEDLRKAFLRMARIREDGQFARQAVRWSDLPERVHPVLTRLEEGRLLVSGDGEDGQRTVEVAHEALFRSWDRLKTWLDEDREFLLWRNRLRVARREWERANRDEAALLKGSILQEATSWSERKGDELTKEERAFLAASIEAREKALRARRNRARAFVGFVVAVAAGMFGLFLNARSERLKAEDSARLAVANQWLSQDPTVAALVLLEVRDSALARPVMRRVLNARPARVVSLGPDPIDGHTAIGPDAAWVLTISRDSVAHVWSLDGSGGETIPLGASVGSARFSPDGRRVVTVSGDGSARIWTLDAPGSPVELASTEEVFDAGFTPDGQRVVTASGEAVLWTLDGARDSLFAPEAGTTVPAFSPDGRWMVTLGLTARLWPSDRSEGPARSLGTRLFSAAFSPDGARLLTITMASRASVLSLTDPGRVTELSPWVTSASFSPDGQRVAAAEPDSTVKIWTLGSGEAPVELPHPDTVASLDFSPDGSRLVTASADGVARIWSLDNPNLGTVSLLGHTGPVLAARFGPDGTRVITVSGDGTARVWPVEPPGARVLEGARAEWVALSPDGTRLVTVPDTWRGAQVWALDGGADPIELQHADRVSWAEFSPDGLRVVTASDDATARVWTLDGSEDPVVLTHPDWVHAATFALDGRRVLTAAQDGTARIWGLDEPGSPMVELSHAGVTFASFSPDGDRVVTGSDLGETAIVWTLAAPEAPDSLHGHADWLTSATFAPGGDRVLTSSMDGTARVWDLVGGDGPTHTLEHGAAVLSASFSPDGRHVATASRDRSARVWPVSAPGDTLVLSHASEVVRASFSPDGGRVVTVARDATARLWTLSSPRAPVTLAHPDIVASATFSADGQRLVVVTEAGAVLVWDVGYRSLRAALEASVETCLDPAFREQQLGERPDDARDRYAACERRRGRGSPQAPSP